MKHFASLHDPEITAILKAGGVGVLRTDTLYGLVAMADNESAVGRVYELKGRDDDKSPIVLIDDYDQLYDQPQGETNALLQSVWPGPVSVILPSSRAPLWIRRGNDSVAYRMSNHESLRRLVRVSGPLIAPSANPQGQPTAPNIAEAEAYFGDRVDFYVNGGQVVDPTPSQLIRVNHDGSTEQLR